MLTDGMEIFEIDGRLTDDADVTIECVEKQIHDAMEKIAEISGGGVVEGAAPQNKQAANGKKTAGEFDGFAIVITGDCLVFYLSSTSLLSFIHIYKENVIGALVYRLIAHPRARPCQTGILHTPPVQRCYIVSVIVFIDRSYTRIVTGYVCMDGPPGGWSFFHVE